MGAFDHLLIHDSDSDSEVGSAHSSHPAPAAPSAPVLQEEVTEGEDNESTASSQPESPIETTDSTSNTPVAAGGGSGGVWGEEDATPPYLAPPEGATPSVLEASEHGNGSFASTVSSPATSGPHEEEVISNPVEYRSPLVPPVHLNRMTAEEVVEHVGLPGMLDPTHNSAAAAQLVALHASENGSAAAPPEAMTAMEFVPPNDGASSSKAAGHCGGFFTFLFCGHSDDDEDAAPARSSEAAMVFPWTTPVEEDAEEEGHEVVSSAVAEMGSARAAIPTAGGDEHSPEDDTADCYLSSAPLNDAARNEEVPQVDRPPVPLPSPTTGNNSNITEEVRVVPSAAVIEEQEKGEFPAAERTPLPTATASSVAPSQSAHVDLSRQNVSDTEAEASHHGTSAHDVCHSATPSAIQSRHSRSAHPSAPASTASRSQAFAAAADSCISPLQQPPPDSCSSHNALTPSVYMGGEGEEMSARQHSESRSNRGRSTSQSRSAPQGLQVSKGDEGGRTRMKLHPSVPSDPPTSSRPRGPRREVHHDPEEEAELPDELAALPLYHRRILLDRRQHDRREADEISVMWKDLTFSPRTTRSPFGGEDGEDASRQAFLDRLSRPWPRKYRHTVGYGGEVCAKPVHSTSPSIKALSARLFTPKRKVLPSLPEPSFHPTISPYAKEVGSGSRQSVFARLYRAASPSRGDVGACAAMEASPYGASSLFTDEAAEMRSVLRGYSARRSQRGHTAFYPSDSEASL